MATTKTKQPSQTFEQDIAAYQAGHPSDLASFEGMFQYLTDLGHLPVRPTHAGGTLNSNDKIADGVTGKMYDVIYDEGGPGAKWNAPDPNRPASYWYNGKDQGMTPPTVLGTGGPQAPSTQTGTAPAPPTTSKAPQQIMGADGKMHTLTRIQDDPSANAPTLPWQQKFIPGSGGKTSPYVDDPGKAWDQVFTTLTPAMKERARQVGINLDMPDAQAWLLQDLQRKGGLDMSKKNTQDMYRYIGFGLAPEDDAGLGTLASGPGGDLTTQDKYAAANTAALQQRKKARFGGRQSTILGGFGAGPRPATAPTVLGGYAA